MSFAAKLSLKLVTTLIASAVAFYIGAVVSAACYKQWILPGILKKYPHDGQVGLELLFVMVTSASVCALIALCMGIALTVKTSKRSIT